MRKASWYLALLGSAALGLPAAAVGAPSVTLKARAVPIPKNLSSSKGPTWPHTGNILGAPAAVEALFTIKGSEYPTASEGWGPGTKLDVGPAPLRRVVFYLPKGTRVNAKGFPTCPISKFSAHLEPPCPKGSLASPPGEANGTVFFGGTAVKEKVLVQAYFTPGGKLTFWIEGRTPAVIEEFASGALQKASGPFNTKLNTMVPLISTTPGAPDAMAEQIKVTVGAAMKKKGKLVSYGYMPKTCPRGGFPVKAELWFGGGSESSWQKVVTTAKAPCPVGAAKAHKSSVNEYGKGKSKHHHNNGRRRRRRTRRHKK